MTQIVSSQADVVKKLQYYNEGVLSTPANFAKAIPSSTTFLQAGKNPTWNYSDEITAEEEKNVGTLTRSDRVVTRKRGTLSITTNISDADVALVKYCMNAPDTTTATADSSLAFLFSFKVAGTETFRILRGCLPESASINVTNTGFVEFTATFAVYSPADEVTTSNGGLTTPTFATQSTNTAWSHSDSGSNPFTWDSVTYPEMGFSVDVGYEHTVLESSGDLTIQWATISQRTISGSASVFKKDSLLQADTTAGNKITATRVLKTSTLTASFTEAVIDTNPYSVSADSSATIEELSFTAKELALA
jgi:hypothetical protein